MTWTWTQTILVAAAGVALAPGVQGSATDPVPEPVRRVYPHLLEPKEHPDYGRRAVMPPTWSTFRNRTQFTCLRGFGIKDGRLVGFVEELEKFTRAHALGNASIFNRRGDKTYGSAGGSGAETHSPTHGTSLSLMKRLLDTHILDNCVAVGFENGWFEGEHLSPIGRIAARPVGERSARPDPHRRGRRNTRNQR